ncbi:hypothetical protein ES703_67031 [subsurface metagenome]
MSKGQLTDSANIAEALGNDDMNPHQGDDPHPVWALNEQRHQKQDDNYRYQANPSCPVVAIHDRVILEVLALKLSLK